MDIYSADYGGGDDDQIGHSRAAWMGLLFGVLAAFFLPQWTLLPRHATKYQIGTLRLYRSRHRMFYYPARLVSSGQRKSLTLQQDQRIIHILAPRLRRRVGHQVEIGGAALNHIKKTMR